jgi:hypothetical protein
MMAFLVFACGLLVLSCSNLTQENYNKIKVGMSYAETVKLLGTDHRCDSALGIKNCAWGGGEKVISIQFLGDKVVLFSGKGLN